MRVSVAMATYNGAAYISEQLDSLFAQTRQPDELVITDDASSDETAEIAERFARNVKFPVYVLRNRINLGYAENFAHAMMHCTGDLIFLSDQDDVWFPSKIETILSLTRENERTLVFMNDAELAHGDGTPTGLTKLGQNRTLSLKDSQFATGCCMALRREFLDVALPLPSADFVHDTWLNRLAGQLDVKMVTPSVLQYFRRHGDNASDAITSRTEPQSQFDLALAYRARDPRGHARRRIRQLAQLEYRLREGKAALFKQPWMAYRVDNAIQEIERERRAVYGRLHVLEISLWRRWTVAAAFYLRGQYGYFSGWRSLLKDILKA